MRNVYGNTIGIQVFCNCPNEDIEKYSGFLEDEFYWCHNNGHYKGALDHTNMVVQSCNDFDYVIVMAAKTLWTDYSLLREIIINMKKESKKFAAFKDDGTGHFKNKNEYAFFCDVLIFESSFYKEVFPIKFDQESFPEKQITKKILDLIKKEDVYYIPCTPPDDTMEAFSFKNILGTNEIAFSIKEFDKKFNEIKVKNPKYALVIEKLLSGV